MNNRLKSGLIVLGLSVVAVPTLVAARSHYTGKVPASIALAPVPKAPRVTSIAPARTARKVAHEATAPKVAALKVASHKQSAAKKKVAVKHPVAKKTHHKLAHKKTAM